MSSSGNQSVCLFLIVDTGTVHARNSTQTDKNIFGFAKQTEKQPKQIRVSAQTENLCFDDTIATTSKS
jgi:hypothetical protein